MIVDHSVSRSIFLSRNLTVLIVFYYLCNQAPNFCCLLHFCCHFTMLCQTDNRVFLIPYMHLFTLYGEKWSMPVKSSIALPSCDCTSNMESTSNGMMFCLLGRFRRNGTYCWPLNLSGRFKKISTMIIFTNYSCKMLILFQSLYGMQCDRSNSLIFLYLYIKLFVLTYFSVTSSNWEWRLHAYHFLRGFGPFGKHECIVKKYELYTKPLIGNIRKLPCIIF